jgi:3-phenylpropionate/trans-cinnamate dioxygenase ferredoxin reductase subunit
VAGKRAVNAASRDSGVVVVGAGLAGLRTVEALRRKDYGGPITLVGDEPHPPYDRPPLSKGVLAGDADAGQARLADADRLRALGAKWRPGVAAAAVDPDRRRVALMGQRASLAQAEKSVRESIS